MMTTVTPSAAVAADNGLPDWLVAARERGAQQLAQLVWPGRKTEYWLHTPLSEALETLPETATPAAALTRPDPLAPIAGLEALRLVFLDGRFQPQLSSDLSDYRAQIKILSQLEEGERPACSARINRTFDHALNQDQQVAAWQNLSLLSDGLWLQLAAGAELAQPLQVIFVTSGNHGAQRGSTRILCDLGAAAKATLIEQQLSLDAEVASFSNQLSEIELGPQAVLDHYRLGLEGSQAVSLSAAHVALEKESRYQSFNIASGGACKRNDLLIHHLQGGSHCELNGIYLPRGDEHIDYHSCIEHRVPDCTSNEVFRGILAERSTAVFNGRIHIHPDAQKSLAEMSNKNLLLSDDAAIYSKPELEIYADDVRCAHGATVAQLDEQALYYLQSRGIARDAAEQMLSFAFINELIEEIELKPLQSYLLPFVEAVFMASQESDG